MRSRDSKESKRLARQKRGRATVKGTESRPRLCVFKSLNNINRKRKLPLYFFIYIVLRKSHH